MNLCFSKFFGLTKETKRITFSSYFCNMNVSHYYQYTVKFEVKFEQVSSPHKRYSTFEGFLCFSSLI